MSNKQQGQNGQQSNQQRPSIQLNTNQPPADKPEDKVSTQETAGEISEQGPVTETDSQNTALELKLSTDPTNDASVNISSALEVKPPVIDDSSSTVNSLAPEQTTVSPVVTETTTGVATAVTIPKVQATPVRGSLPNMIKRPGARGREASPPPVQVTPDPVSTRFAALISKEKKEGTANAIDLISFLERYVTTMAPGRITSAETIIRFQEGLLDHITTVVEHAPAAEFKRLWRILIEFVNEYGDKEAFSPENKKGAFSPSHYARGVREWKRDPKLFDVLTSSVNLLEASRDLKTVNQVADVSRLANLGFSEEGRGRLLNFYAA